eukprot:TRINITY_DN6909_c0_g1_i3.p1 TRINITY_DN6909_c0_g1~~TRINITY_DN6909_c0_g1_i3.p1  ORF type:complete len:408 (-),score=122.98 TRINITY_DN6909_c0_g1_i3:99-1322(-)
MSILAKQILTLPGGIPRISTSALHTKLNKTLAVQNVQLCSAVAMKDKQMLLSQDNCDGGSGALFSDLFSGMSLHTSSSLGRARQATRERKRKVYMANKKKKEERLRKNPVVHITIKEKQEMLAKGITKMQDWRPKDWGIFPSAEDNFWCSYNFTEPRWPLTDALSFLREHYHPSMLNDSNAIVRVKLEFDMKSGKQGRFVDAFNKMVPMMNGFERGVSEKTVLVFAKSAEAAETATQAGAKKVGGTELIDDIAKGKVDIIDFDYVLAHEDILLDLKPLIGILRDQFPKKTLGTVGTDMAKLVKTFSNGQYVEVEKPSDVIGYNNDPSYARCEAMIGRLQMEDKLIEENFISLLQNMMEASPKKNTGFITKAEIFVDERLKKKMRVHHDLIHDPLYTNYLKTKQAATA